MSSLRKIRFFFKDVFDGEKLCKAAAEGNVEEVIQQLAGDGVADKLKDNPTSRSRNESILSLNCLYIYII